MAKAPPTAAALRARIVTIVVVALAILTFGLYAEIGVLLWARGVDGVPDSLWLAAGTQSGVLGALLINSKGGVEGGGGAGEGDPTTISAPPSAQVQATLTPAPAADGAPDPGTAPAGVGIDYAPRP